MLIFLLLLDVYILNAVQATIIFCVEWFSWSRVWIERVLIGMLGASLVACDMYAIFHHFLPLALVISILIVDIPFQVISILSLWDAHKHPDSTRLVFMVLHAMPRGLVTIVTSLVGVMLAIMPPYDISCIIYPSGLFLYILCNYATVLPSGGDKGKRRKKAVDKLKSVVGSIGVPDFAPQTP